ncbi:MAG: hypothetical protein WKG00_13910 [Polyangiaceae bacterium]
MSGARALHLVALQEDLRKPTHARAQAPAQEIEGRLEGHVCGDPRAIDIVRPAVLLRHRRRGEPEVDAQPPPREIERGPDGGGNGVVERRERRLRVAIDVGRPAREHRLDPEIQAGTARRAVAHRPSGPDADAQWLVGQRLREHLPHRVLTVRIGVVPEPDAVLAVGVGGDRQVHGGRHPQPSRRRPEHREVRGEAAGHLDLRVEEDLALIPGVGHVHRGPGHGPDGDVHAGAEGQPGRRPAPERDREARLHQPITEELEAEAVLEELLALVGEEGLLHLEGGQRQDGVEAEHQLVVEERADHAERDVPGDVRLVGVGARHRDVGGRQRAVHQAGGGAVRVAELRVVDLRRHVDAGGARRQADRLVAAEHEDAHARRRPGLGQERRVVIGGLRAPREDARRVAVGGGGAAGDLERARCARGEGCTGSSDDDQASREQPQRRGHPGFVPQTTGLAPAGRSAGER